MREEASIGPDLLQRQLEGFLAKLTKKYGDLKGKVEIALRSEVSFKEIGGLARAKQEIQGFVYALKSPELPRKWGTKPHKGILLYGPPGTGKTLLARALAHEAEAVFFHLRVSNVVAKWYADAGELIQEVFLLAKENGRSILFLDELEALTLPAEEARAVGRRIVNTVAENLDDLNAYDQIMAVAASNRVDAVDPLLIQPGRLYRFIEVPLPESDEKREIFRLHQARAEALAGRKLFDALDYDSLLARTVKMSGADLAEIVQRALEEKVRLEGSGEQPGLVTTEDLQRVIESYRRTQEIVEKIRYGQYL
ncbi:MAG: 26S protease regulatory subunit [candidate division NC10 bacterium]|nr:26S protease regulatory subunit [candidate division NC10 bacterium]